MYNENTGNRSDNRLNKKYSILKSLVKNKTIKVEGILITLTPNIMNPVSKNKPTIASGNFGKSLMIKRKCGWDNTKNTQNAAKYIIYGVKIESNSIIAKINE